MTITARWSDCATLDEDGGSFHRIHGDVGAAVKAGRSAKKGAEAPFCLSVLYV
jgi:hypothetical protein